MKKNWQELLECTGCPSTS